MRTLGAEEIARLLPMPDAIAIAARAFGAISRGEGVYPQRVHLALQSGDGLVMPGYDGGAYLGTKIVTVHPAGGTRATYILLDADAGEPLLLCDGAALTALRTAAASGLATRRLAKADAKFLALFGTGRQAPAQLEAIFAVRPLEEVRVVGRNAERGERFVDEARRRYPRARIAHCEPNAALDGAQIVVTATNAQTPVFDGTRVAPGTHVNAIGSFRPEMRELDRALLKRARVVVDQRVAALAEAGELIDAVDAGVLDPAGIEELGELREAARRDDAEITVFKSVGHAALDLLTAIELVQRSS